MLVFQGSNLKENYYEISLNFICNHDILFCKMVRHECKMISRFVPSFGKDPLKKPSEKLPGTQKNSEKHSTFI